jgi:hypothetical protein
MTYYGNTMDLGGRYGRVRQYRNPNTAPRGGSALTNPNAAWRSQPMTDTQAAKIVKELGRRVLDSDAGKNGLMLAALLDAVNKGQTRDGKPATKGSASDLIDWLMAKPYVPFGTELTPAAPTTTVRNEMCTEEGIYRYDGAVYRVSESKRNPGRFVARRVTGSGWEYAKGVIFKLTPEMKMTAAEIAEFGIRTEICAQCSRRLNDPVSKHIGLGTKCGPEILGRPEYNAARKAAKLDPKVIEQLAAIEAGKASELARANQAQLDTDRYWDAQIQQREAAQERAAYTAKMARDEWMNR